MNDQNPHSPAPVLQGERGRDFRSKVKPRKKGGVGGRCFKIWILFLMTLFTLLIGNKINQFSQVRSLLPMMVIDE